MEEKKEKRAASSFLSNLQQALKTGKANESTNIINKIDEVSKTMNADEAMDKLTNRIEKVGYADSVTEEEMVKSQSAFESEMAKYKIEEEKLMDIANIENLKSEINATRDEVTHVIKEIEKKYGDLINNQTTKLIQLKNLFKEKYGQEEYEKNIESRETKSN